MQENATYEKNKENGKSISILFAYKSADPSW